MLMMITIMRRVVTKIVIIKFILKVVMELLFLKVNLIMFKVLSL